jgi:hypothetical protein
VSLWRSVVDISNERNVELQYVRGYFDKVEHSCLPGAKVVVGQFDVEVVELSSQFSRGTQIGDGGFVNLETD